MAAREKVKPSHTLAKEMINAHNFLLRGINSIYLQCINVERSPEDVPAFVNYASCWSRILHHHHSSEEEWIFPDIEKITGEKGIMDVNVQQHQAFEKGIEEYTAYVASVKEGKEKYEGARLKAIIDSFMPTLHEHLVAEVDNLKGLEKYEDKTDWAKWTTDTLNKVVKKNENPDAFVSILLSVHLSRGSWTRCHRGPLSPNSRRLIL